MTITPRLRRLIAAGAVLAVGGVTAAVQSTSWANEGRPGALQIKHIVVIYEENHSFDNLFGGWEGVNGLAQAATSGRVTQVAADGTPLPCLPQNDVNLAIADTGAGTCSVTAPNGTVLSSSRYDNAPFNIDQYIRPEDRTCPEPDDFAHPNGILDPNGLPGGCTRDLVHRFYSEQYQIDGGKQDRYVAGSDAIGLSMGYYDTTRLPIYQYLHGPEAPRYVVADNFFQAAFGGSFLNHQWLIAARSPVYPGTVPPGLNSVVPADGNPRNTPLHVAAPGSVDSVLTQAADADGNCLVPAGAQAPPPGTACGNYAINTMQPSSVPSGSFGAKLPLQDAPTIGDRLSGKGVDWAWYSGGWSNAAGIVGGPGWSNGTGPTCSDADVAGGATFPYCADKSFQFHHQPFNYFARYAAPADPTQHNPERDAHLRDEAEFIASAGAGTLKPVSFVKPLGVENEHPGYTGEYRGSDHLVKLLQAIENGPDADSTMVIVTYDEFGGQWDHVPPPTGPGISDEWGPGTRIPALVISPALAAGVTVDHTEYDTTSVLATIEHRFNLKPLATRDAAVADLWPLFHPGNCLGHSNCTNG